MSAASDELLPGERLAASEPSAPLRPIEGPIVQSALALRDARASLDAALWLLANDPRDPSSRVQILGAWNKVHEALSAYDVYRDILSCKGSA